MDGFKRTFSEAKPTEPAVVVPEPVTQLEELNPAPKEVTNPVLPTPQSTPETSPTTQKRRKRGIKLLIVIIAALLLTGLGLYGWYALQLQPIDASSDQKQQFVVKEGEAFSDIASRLKAQGLIRNVLAFDIAARLGGQRAGIKAGTCSFVPSLSSREILSKLIEGCHDFMTVTFYPGATIEKPLYKSPGATVSQTLYVKNLLKEAGYSDDEIARGLSASYESPLFAGKPSNTTLEGYIYGETHYFATDATVESVFQVVFDEMYKVVEANNLPEAYKKQGLKTLYEGITMASIVQRELNCEDKPTTERKEGCYQYQRKIAQVFLKRLREDIPLGSDVTFIYAADMAGEQPTIDFDSPYNTRINTGLPPGPIGAPGELALRAVANPSDTDYLYFLAGDDGLIYFSKTQAEHDQNTKEHCKITCFELN